MKVCTLQVYILLLCFILSLNGISVNEKEYDIDSFRTSLFKWHRSEGYYYVKLGLDKSLHFAGYVTFDSDNKKMTDLITYKVVSNSSVEFYINEFDEGKAVFKTQEEKLIYKTTELVNVTNVYVGPLVNEKNYGYIITVSKGESDYITIFLDSNGKQFESLKISPIFIGDINGDRNIEIIAYKDDSRKIYYIKKTGSNYNVEEHPFSSILIDESSDINDAGNKYMEYKFAGLGAALIDVDADCRNDLILTSEDGDGNKFLEIYRGRVDPVSQTVKYVLNEQNGTINLGSEKLGPFALGDFNDDGLVDLIFPVLSSESEKPKVKILYNIYPLHYYWADQFCKKHPQHKDVPPVFNSITHFVDFVLDLPNYTFAISPISPTIIRVADFKNKAHPGFGAIFRNKNNNTTKLVLFENRCTKTSETTNIFSEDLSEEIENINYFGFFDIDENGNIDVLVDCKEGTKGIYNNYFPDTYFIKAKTLLFDQLYATEIGTNYRYIATDNDGDRRMDFAWQLAMTADLTLNPPYALVGIGRSNNYIENLEVITNSYDRCKDSKGEDTYSISPVIPKTQLLITKELKSNKIDWNVDLIVSPTEKLLIMMIVIGAILILILIVIIVLHIRETKEDKKQESGTEQFKSWFN